MMREELVDIYLSSLSPLLGYLQISSVQLLSHVQLLRPRESQHARPPCLSLTPEVHSNSTLQSRLTPQGALEWRSHYRAVSPHKELWSGYISVLNSLCLSSHLQSYIYIYIYNHFYLPESMKCFSFPLTS